MPFFDGVSGRVFYRHWAAEEPRAGIVFLHGFGEHSGLYHRLAGQLDRRGISLWALDEIGHGLTEGRRGYVESIDALEANGRSLAAIARRASPGLPLVVAGHSLGGATAALLATRDPDPFVGAVLSGAPLSAPAWLAEADPDGGLELEASDLSSDPFYLDELASDPLAFTDSDASPLGALPPAWAELADTLASVRVPVLLVHGSEDPVAPVQINRDWAARIDSATLAEFAGARLDVLNESVHREVAAAIADFTLRVAGAGKPAG